VLGASRCQREVSSTDAHSLVLTLLSYADADGISQ